jgi:hypothetical protein
VIGLLSELVKRGLVTAETRDRPALTSAVEAGAAAEAVSVRFETEVQPGATGNKQTASSAQPRAVRNSDINASATRRFRLTQGWRVSNEARKIRKNGLCLSASGS